MDILVNHNYLQINCSVDDVCLKFVLEFTIF